MTPSPRTVTWPRTAAYLIEAVAVAAIATVLSVLVVAVWALAQYQPLRPVLAVLSGFLVGFAVRVGKDSRELWASYCGRRRGLLDRICTHLETRRISRQWQPDTGIPLHVLVIGATSATVSALLWWRNGGWLPLIGFISGTVAVAMAIARPWVLGPGAEDTDEERAGQ